MGFQVMALQAQCRTEGLKLRQWPVDALSGWAVEAAERPPYKMQRAVAAGPLDCVEANGLGAGRQRMQEALREAPTSKQFQAEAIVRDAQQAHCSLVLADALFDR